MADENRLEFAVTFERGAAALLVDVLGDVDDDDDVRTCLVISEILSRMEQVGYDPGVPGVGREEALFLLRNMVERRITAGELRRNIARAMGELARG